MTRLIQMLLLVAFLGIACGEQPTGPVPDSSPTPDPTPDPSDEPVAADVAVVPEAVSLGQFGQSVSFQATVRDADGVELPEAGVAWSSSNPGSIAIDGAGRATARHLGSAIITARAGDVLGSASAEFALAAVTGEVVGCTGGEAAGFPCDRVDLLSFLPLADLGVPDWAKVNDMWGWTDAATSRQYALVGRTDGLSFVDVTDPLNPEVLGELPTAANASTWRDVKVHADHAYVVADGSPGHGVQVFDLTRLRGVSEFTTFDEDARYTGVSSVHNIAINEETGFAYTVGNNGGGNPCGPGLHMIDLSSPKTPVLAGCFTDLTTGRALTGYTHDVQCVVYAGPDGDYSGREICVGSNETALSIADVTDKENPVAVSTASYPDASYVHQGWLTEDHRYFVQNDELDELSGNAATTRMLVWDVTDLDDPILVKEHFGPTGAIDHNMYVRGDLLFHSNYHYGLRVIDVSNPTTPVEVGHFDTHPQDDDPAFEGSWSNYPWFADGVVGVTSAQEGFFLLRLQ